MVATEVVEVVAHTEVVTEKEVTQEAVEEIEVEEVDLLDDLHQEESHQLVAEEVVVEAQVLLKEDLMQLQKGKEETKLPFFLQQNLLNNKAQNKQHLQNPYFQI